MYLQSRAKCPNMCTCSLTLVKHKYKFIKETKINKLAYILKKKTYRFFISVCVCCKPWVLGFQKEKETKSIARADARFLRGRPCSVL